eukprot:comp23857_c0_seq1/m.41716 comp23857_c0_seq1/g.41716  ORF comp23857_c0_seq1/g.41716 comp23857_c0_seq1/m.41716 type:complete len:791 (-) comp23857_c0_seq1:828-3200(-)
MGFTLPAFQKRQRYSLLIIAGFCLFLARNGMHGSNDSLGRFARSVHLVNNQDVAVNWQENTGKPVGGVEEKPIPYVEDEENAPIEVPVDEAAVAPAADADPAWDIDPELRMPDGWKSQDAAIYRIVNNDLRRDYPDIIKHLFDNEEPLFTNDVYYVLNKISNPEMEKRLQHLVEANGYVALVIPFNYTTFRSIPLGFQQFGRIDPVRNHKYKTPKMRGEADDTIYFNRTTYVYGRKDVRSLVLDHAKTTGYTWATILDADCYLYEKAWARIAKGLVQVDEGVSSARITVTSVHADAIRSPNFETEYMGRDLQASQEVLRVAGNPHPPTAKSPSVGWLPRVYLTEKHKPWARANKQAMQGALKSISSVVSSGVYNMTADVMMTYNETVLKAEKVAYQANNHPALTRLVKKLVGSARSALKVGPWSVMDKFGIAPSGNRHDYYSIKPYYWPNPATRNKMPYIRKDGQRVPGSILYNPQSLKYDRTSLANMFRNTTVLGLAFFFTDNPVFGQKAVQNIRTWFLDPATRMTPNSRFAQIQWGYANNLGRSTGILEFRNFHYFLDVVRLLYNSKALPQSEFNDFKAWMAEYAKHLDSSEQARGEFESPNNHGLYFDIQRIAIAAFLGQTAKVTELIELSRGRIQSQFADDGSLPEEMARETQLHYMMFTLHGWMTLAMMAQRVGINMWAYQDLPNIAPAIKRCAVFTVPYFNSTWTHPQTETEDMRRMVPLYFMAINRYTGLRNTTTAPGWVKPTHLYRANPIFHELDGPHPFWNLGLSLKYGVGTKTPVDMLQQ